MAAARAMLETWELLESIIAEVPAHHIEQLKPVSKYFNRIIKESHSIRKARCIKPTSWFNNKTIGDIPSYGPGFEVKIHPRMFHSIGSKEMNTMTNILCKRISVKRYDILGLQHYRAEYATSPRCSTMTMSLTGPWGSAARIDCMVFVKNGIKIGDILEVRDALVKTFYRHLRGKKGRISSSSEADLEITSRLAEERLEFELCDLEGVSHPCPKSSAAADSDEFHSNIDISDADPVRRFSRVMEMGEEEDDLILL